MAISYIIQNKRKLAILQVTPINFSIKSEGEQEVYISTFRKFLNALDFPIQILITTDVLDLNEYLANAEKKIDKTHDKLFNNYKEFLLKTITSNSVMNRNFYIVIPEISNLDIQVDIVEEKLRNMNLEFKLLAKDEPKVLVKKFFNNKDLPSKIINNFNSIDVDNTLNRVVYAHGYPRTVEAGFLDKLVSALGNFDISLHITPFPIETLMININRQLQKQSADLYSMQNKGILNPSLEIQYSDTRAILEQLQKGQDKLFHVSLYVNCRAKDKKELDLITKRVEAELNSLLIIPRKASMRMAQGFKSVMPFAIDELQARRNITAESLSAFFPFTSPFLKLDDSGVWLGLNKNRIPIIRDIFKLSNPNGVVLAQSGGGKSYFTKLLIARYLLNGVKIIVIDPQGEYRNLVKHFNGQRINLSRTSKTMINPLDLMGHDYYEKRLSLMDLMPVMLGELTEPQKSFIDKALTKAYESKGIDIKKSTWKNQPPVLKDILDILDIMEKRAITLEKTTIRSLINRLSLYVDGVFSFMNRHTKINFNKNFVCFDIGDMPKQIKPLIMFLVLDYVYMKMRKDINRKLLIIDEAWSLLSRTEDCSYIFEIVKTCRKFNMGLLLINQEVEGLLNSHAGKSVLANTSYTVLFRQKPAVIEQIQETFHLSRAERGFLLTANVGEGILIVDDDHSEIKVIASEEEHKLITTNADEILQNQEVSKMEQIKQIEKKEVDAKVVTETDVSGTSQKSKIFGLPETQSVSEHLGKHSFPREVKSAEPKMASETEVKPTQKPTPKKEYKRSYNKSQYKKVVQINVMEDKLCYNKKYLSTEEAEYRLKNGYHESIQYNIYGTKYTYLLKPRSNESDEHLFLIYQIKNFLEKITKKVWTFQANNPDIVFETFDGLKIAVEVETGQVLKHSPKQLENKVRLLKDRFGDNWFFVMTNRNYASKYQKYGETIDKRSLVNKLQSYFPDVEPSKPVTKSVISQNADISLETPEVEALSS